MRKSSELIGQLKLVFGNFTSIIEVILPVLVFTILQGQTSLEWALFFAGIPVLLLLIYRLINQQSLLYLVMGSSGLLISFVVAWVSGTTEGFFLPSILTDLIIVVICLISLIIKKPFVALSSHLTRKWPLDWYWHDAVRPAYASVTKIWMVYFALRIFPQWILFTQGDTKGLGWLNILTGFPGLVVLLIGSYLYGQSLLKRLNGPSVEEFKQKNPPPWEGQKSGF
jgi:hypothetical protein